MRRYRVLGWDFDFRANTLNLSTDGWTVEAKEQQQLRINDIEKGLISEFGTRDAREKIKRFKEIGAKPFSVIAYHNALLDQIRSAYVQGSYYPALVGACTLGERILNHLVLDLRNSYAPRFKPSKQKRNMIWKNRILLGLLKRVGFEMREVDIFADKNFTNWNIMIENLASWSVINDEVAVLFRKLSKKRHKSIHFNESTIANLQQEAIESIDLLQKIIQKQFPAFGGEYFLPVPGEAYLKKELELKPFFVKYYIPNSRLVTPYNEIIQIEPSVKIKDTENVEEKDITDDEFVKLRRDRKIPQK